MNKRLLPAYQAFLKYHHAKNHSFKSDHPDLVVVDRAYTRFCALVPDGIDPDLLLLKWDSELSAHQTENIHQGG